MFLNVPLDYAITYYLVHIITNRSIHSNVCIFQSTEIGSNASSVRLVVAHVSLERSHAEFVDIVRVQDVVLPSGIQIQFPLASTSAARVQGNSLRTGTGDVQQVYKNHTVHASYAP